MEVDISRFSHLWGEDTVETPPPELDPIGEPADRFRHLWDDSPKPKKKKKPPETLRTPDPVAPLQTHTPLENMNYLREKELATGIPRDFQDINALRERYKSSLGTPEEDSALIDLQIAERHNAVGSERIASERAKMQAAGMTPEQYRIAETYKYEQEKLGPDARLANLPFMRGIVSGAESAASVPAELALRATGNSDKANQLARSRQETAKFNSYADQQQGRALGYVRQLSEMTAKYLPAGALKMVLPTIGAETLATKQHEGLKSGMSEVEALGYGSLHATKDVLLTLAGGKVAGKLGGRTFEQAVGMGGGAALNIGENVTLGKAAPKAFADLAKHLTKTLGLSASVELGVEELPQYAAELLIDKYTRSDYKPKSWREIGNDVADIVAVTALGQTATAHMETASPADKKKIKAAKEFIDNPSRRTAVEAGVDGVADTKAARDELAGKAKKVVADALTAKSFKSQLDEVAASGAITTEQSQYLYDLTEARAKAAGEGMDEYVGKRIKGVETAKWGDFKESRKNVMADGAIRRAEIEFVKDDGRAVIRAFETANFVSVVHELGHLFRRDLAGPDMDIAATWAGAKNGKWNRNAEEKFARGFEQYMLTGKAPTKQLAKAFGKISDWMKGVYQTIRNNPNVNISPEMRGVYDRLFTEQEQDVATATNTTTAPLEPQAPEPAPEPADAFASERAYGPTGIKNESVDEQRAQRGLPPLMAPMRVSNQTSWDAAMAKIDENPLWQDSLINELEQNPRPVDTIESMGLSHRYAVLSDQLHTAAEKLLNAQNRGAADEVASLQAEADLLTTKLADLEAVTQAVGTEQGRAFQARKVMVNEDYSLAQMLTKARVAKGSELSVEESAKVQELQAKIDELQKKFDAKVSTKSNKKLTDAVGESMKKAEKDAKSRSKKKTGDPLQDGMAGLQKNKEKGQPPAKNYLDLLARHFWQQGVRGQEAMLDSLHGVTQEMFGMSRDDTARAWSGYGDFTPISKAEIDAGLRDLKGQTQQLLKIEALENQKPLEKTGVERRVPSDEERRLIKVVNELKKKFGVVVTDPATQLKSALEGRRTYYKNRLADLKHEIETRQRIVKSTTPSPTDPELDKLIAEYHEAQAQHAEIFQKPDLTDEQRLELAIKAAERTEKAWQEKLAQAKDGKYDWNAKKKRALTSPELEAIKARIAEHKAAAEELRTLQDPLWKDGKAVEARKKYYAKRMEQLRQEIATKQKAPKKPGNQPVDAELDLMLTVYNSLKEEHDAIFGRPELTDAQRLEIATKAAEANAAKWKERLELAKEGKLDWNTPDRRTYTSDEIEAFRKQSEESKAAVEELRNAQDPGWKQRAALKALKARMAAQEAGLRERIANGDYESKPRTKTELDDEGAKMKAQLDLARKEFKEGLEKWKWDRMTPFQKFKRRAADAYDFARIAMTTGEASFVLRQAKHAMAAHPVRTVKTLADAWRSFKSEENALAADAKLQSHPEFNNAVQAKVHFSFEDTALSKKEEFAQARLIGKIAKAPVLRQGSQAVAAFGRAGRTFMNKVRFDSYLAMRKSLAADGIGTPEQQKAIAKFVNEATGRGSLGGFEKSAVEVNRIFFSARFMTSRFQYLLGHSMWAGDKATRKAIAGEYARAAVGLSMYYTMLSWWMDDEDEKVEISTDPTSSDFLKIKVGNTRIDPFAGIQQVVVLGSRLALGRYTDQKGKEVAIRGPKARKRATYVIADFLSGKLHPTPGRLLTLLNGTNVDGSPVTIGGALQETLTPITYADIYDAFKSHDLDEAATISLLAFFGEGVQTYGKRPTAKGSQSDTTATADR